MTRIREDGGSGPEGGQALLVATRSRAKLREIRAILAELPGLRVIDLEEAGVSATPDEDGLEVFETFAKNAAAKARYFQRLTGLPTIADDSGLEVDALGGGPGVRSKRFAPGSKTKPADEVDAANNRHLLQMMKSIPEDARGARYVCAAVLDAGEGGGLIFEGEAGGTILRAPRGTGGFGYDPLFLDPDEGRTFAEMSPAEKHARSHRGAAFRALADHLSAAAAAPEGSAPAGMGREPR